MNCTSHFATYDPGPENVISMVDPLQNPATRHIQLTLNWIPNLDHRPARKNEVTKPTTSLAAFSDRNR